LSLDKSRDFGEPSNNHYLFHPRLDSRQSFFVSNFTIAEHYPNVTTGGRAVGL